MKNMMIGTWHQMTQEECVQELKQLVCDWPAILALTLPSALTRTSQKPEVLKGKYSYV